MMLIIIYCDNLFSRNVKDYTVIPGDIKSYVEWNRCLVKLKDTCPLCRQKWEKYQDFDE